MSTEQTGVLHLTAVIRSEDGGYASVCPELSIASQGDTVEEAKAMLQEALELFFEDAEPEEYDHLLNGQSEIFPVQVSGLSMAVPRHRQVKIGTLLAIIKRSGVPISEFE